MDKELKEALKEYVDEGGWGKTTKIHAEEFVQDPGFAWWFINQLGCVKWLAILGLGGFLYWFLTMGSYKLFFTYKEEEYPVQFHSCQGCEELTIGSAGWFCGLGGTGCEYPEETIEKIKKIDEQANDMLDCLEAQ